MVTAAQPATTSTFSPLTTWDGWQQFVDTPPAPALDVGDHEWTLEQREDYHARFVVLKTPAMHAISTAVRRLVLLNRGQQGGARRGLIISGPVTTGKTTAMQQLGRTVELADPRLCAAIVDRLTFGGNLIQTGTDSYRLAITQARAAAQNAAG
ncbi:hypothetical protein P1S61_16360 [Streptomyces sp. ME08-AFT2]|uniref:hypothetical protein n=1 Tax=Streptomyces sp. ME08-AFT2 TaxID=3028683 RepID=UPI0029A2EC27|nr:hypothetical protein [Streptomyces sp. ME08-AFT2]MDX3310621.1 hypothetical protein [Streptomyces sp. ME08-AFT2]